MDTFRPKYTCYIKKEWDVYFIVLYRLYIFITFQLSLWSINILPKFALFIIRLTEVSLIHLQNNILKTRLQLSAFHQFRKKVELVNINKRESFFSNGFLDLVQPSLHERHSKGIRTIGFNSNLFESQVQTITLSRGGRSILIS